MTSGPAIHTRHALPCAAFILAAALLATACTSPPARQTGAALALQAPPEQRALAGSKQQTRRHRGLEIAATMLGAPFRYGGSNPHGFDCSGLVYYAYHSAGIAVPRTASAQFRHATPVDPSRLQPGDLLFFRLTSRPVSHVGIYAGDGRFIHAPSQGKRVSYTSLDNPYWKQRIVAAGRY